LRNVKKCSPSFSRIFWFFWFYLRFTEKNVKRHFTCNDLINMSKSIVLNLDRSPLFLEYRGTRDFSSHQIYSLPRMCSWTWGYFPREERPGRGTIRRDPEIWGRGMSSIGVLERSRITLPLTCTLTLKPETTYIGDISWRDISQMPFEEIRASRIIYTCVRDVLVGANKISRTTGKFSRSILRYAIGSDARKHRKECVKERSRIDSQKNPRSVIRIPVICTQIFGVFFEVNVIDAHARKRKRQILLNRHLNFDDFERILLVFAEKL